MKVKKVILKIVLIFCLIILGLSFIILYKTNFSINKETDFYKSSYYNDYLNIKIDQMVNYYNSKLYIDNYDENKEEFSIIEYNGNSKENFSLQYIKDNYTNSYEDIFINDSKEVQYYDDKYKSNEYLCISTNEFYNIMNKYTEINRKEVGNESKIENKEYNNISSIDYDRYYTKDNGNFVYSGWINADFADNAKIFQKNTNVFVYSAQEGVYYNNYMGWINEQEFFNTDKIYIPSSYVDFTSEESRDYSILLAPYFFSLDKVIYTAFNEYINNIYCSNFINTSLNTNNTSFLFAIEDVAANNFVSNIAGSNLFYNIKQYDGETTYTTYDYKEDNNILDSHSKNLLNKLKGENLKITVAIDEANESLDNEYNLKNNIYLFKLANYNKFTLTAFVISGLIVITVVIILINIEVKRKSLIYIDKIPVEFLIVISLFTAILLVFIDSYIYRYYFYNCIVMLGAIVVISYINFEVLLSICRRISCKTILSNLLFRKIYNKAKITFNIIYKARSFSSKKIFKLLCYGMVNIVIVILSIILCISTYGNILFIGIGFIILLAFNIYTIKIYIKYLSGMEKIIESSKEISNGNLNKKLIISDLSLENQELGLTINSIGDGFKKAVERSIKDEKLKSELITNVSHDIKTPLTSIINYVELIKREPIENKKIKEYLKVLDGKSQRLKQLTEDLIEASKASTGNIEFEKANLNVNELFKQAIAEFYEKFNEKSLNIIANIPDELLFIYADGRRAFRVLENLLQNIYKYSMINSRVYLDLFEEEDNVIMSFKNISDVPLNITEDELTERFVRGDESRTTEGSGLGLSIAKNLITLQGGEFKIYIDGDLFKVIIKFKKHVK